MKTPGVDVEDAPGGPRAIEGVSTSTAGMAGRTERGPAEPTLITSWREYQDLFGGTIEGLFLFLAALAIRRRSNSP